MRLLACYPAAWRARYETEVQALIEQSGGSPRKVLNLSRAALDEWRRTTAMRAAGQLAIVVLKAFVFAAGAYFMCSLLSVPLDRAAELLYGPAVPERSVLLMARGVVRRAPEKAIWSGVFVAYSLVVSAPVLLAWRTTGWWRRWPRAARWTFVLAFLTFTEWFRPETYTFAGIILAGWVLADGFFSGAPVVISRSDRPRLSPVFVAALSMMMVEVAFLVSNTLMATNVVGQYVAGVRWLSILGPAAVVAVVVRRRGATRRMAFVRAVSAATLGLALLLALRIIWVRILAESLVQLPFGNYEVTRSGAASVLGYLQSGGWHGFWTTTVGSGVLALPYFALAAWFGILAADSRPHSNREVAA